MDQKGKQSESSSQAVAPVPKPPLPPPIRGEEAVNEGNEEAKMERRLALLHQRLKGERNGTRITNPSFEIGRPSLTRPDDMRRDPANIFSRLSIDDLAQIKPTPVSNNMANSEEMVKIAVAVEGLGVPTEQVANVVLQAVIYCASASSSVYLDPHGTIEYTGGAVVRDSVVAIIKRDAGLRRVCRLFAPLVWNHMLVHNSPPSDWAAMGFQWNDRFAAFDFFDYVENEAAIQPLDGLIRRPTRSEKIAHNTHKRLALDKSNRDEVFASLETEITGGKRGPEISRNFRNAAN
ncbi:coat protein [Potato latent virus]|uniref:Capsid protein n=1 Tax=Potato latent virus TaxID=138982 RepID=Q9DX56_9VIRU|nr:coat protein [Potato latent virus]AAG23710.2 coat protein [Potato latent virus]ACA05830.2 coat protein [Potato latent virus]WIW79787.1 coat protein [Potato latent virus]